MQGGEGILDGVLVGDHRLHVEGPVGEGLQHVVDLVVEPERPGELQLAFDRGGHRHGLLAGWQQPEHDHPATAGGARDGGGEARDAAGGLDGDVGLHPGQRRAFAGEEGAGGTQRTGPFERGLVQVDHGDLGGPGAAQHGDDERSDGPGADHQRAPAAHVARAADGVPRDARGLGHGRRAQRQPGGQRAQHVRAEGDVVREPALGVRSVRGAAEVGAAGGKVGPVGRVALGAVARAGPGGVHRHRRAGRRAGAVGRALADDPDDLVPEQHRLLQYRQPGRAVAPVVQVRAADAAVDDLDDGLGGVGDADRDGLDADVVRRVRDESGGVLGERHHTTAVIPPSTKIVCPFT